MKKTLFFGLLLVATIALQAQPRPATQLPVQGIYWVFLTDKEGTTFDPYTYFDPKAIERYAQVKADLYDPTNYPVNPSYEEGVSALVEENIGTSRWMNAIGVSATKEQISRVEQLPYVLRVEAISSDDWQLSSRSAAQPTYTDPTAEELDSTLDIQLIRMGGSLFRQAGIDGKGVRIAVFDGGFPRVNTHDAFRHLRDDGRILKTWNFPNKKEDVYGWNSHGTMTLSCIAGRKDGRDLGLATGAEFLLARTEIEAEPFKEEIWWMQAVEWADRNGANIISSSLGYGKDRYYTRQMDGTSYVARAANLAARKGMLVVNSAGNENDDAAWKILITPADADSVLCVGGIERSLTEYRHISFASVGPTADGRQKPNVTAFAHAMAAGSSSDHKYELVYGTSFSCPLVAGFAACAWQTNRQLTNMQLFEALQRSADLYPYCDYTFGYGVPQASYFVNPNHQPAAPTFRFEVVDDSTLALLPLHNMDTTYLFYKNTDASGAITHYGWGRFPATEGTTRITFYGGNHITAHFGGYTAEASFPTPTPHELMSRTDGKKEYAYTMRDVRADKPEEKRSHWEFSAQLGAPISIGDGAISSTPLSLSGRIGLRYMYSFSKAYRLGIALEWGAMNYEYAGRAINPMEQALGLNSIINGTDVKRRQLTMDEVSIELFQRVRLVPGGLAHNGLHWDLGIYCSYGWDTYLIKYKDASFTTAPRQVHEFHYNSLLDDYRINYGITTRLTYDIIGLYARLRLNDIWRPADELPLLLPRLEVGINIEL